MAKQTTCDRCGEPALCEMEFKTTVTTPVKMDICEKCLADIKKVLRVYTNQEVGELDDKLAEAVVAKEERIANRG